MKIIIVVTEVIWNYGRRNRSARAQRPALSAWVDRKDKHCYWVGKVICWDGGRSTSARAQRWAPTASPPALVAHQQVCSSSTPASAKCEPIGQQLAASLNSCFPAPGVPGETRILFPCLQQLQAFRHDICQDVEDRNKTICANSNSRTKSFGNLVRVEIAFKLFLYDTVHGPCGHVCAAKVGKWGIPKNSKWSSAVLTVGLWDTPVTGYNPKSIFVNSPMHIFSIAK